MHWWLLVHSSPWCCDFLTLRISLIFYSPSRGSSGKKKEPPLLGIPLIFKNVWAGPEVNSHLSEFLKMKKNGCRWATFKYLCTCVPVFGGYLVWGVGQSDPAPMTAPVPFGMNSSSSQLLDLLQALRLGQFFFFSLTYFKATHKKIYSTAQAFQTTTTYLPPSKTLNLVVTQEQKQCSKRWCYRSNGEVLLQKTMLHRCVEAMLQKQC